MLYRGKPHALGMARDVTARNREARVRSQLEAQLRQAQKMEAIGHLTGGIAHDFNNLLTVIMSRAEFALERLDPQSDVFQQVDGIRRASDRAAALTRQLLSFARRPAGEASVLDLVLPTPAPGGRGVTAGGRRTA